VTADSPALQGLPRYDRGWALFLDVDGTLLDFAGRPEAVVVPPSLSQDLQRIYRFNDGAVALVSGRHVSDLDRLFGPVRYPAAGQHGLERRDASGNTRILDDGALGILASASGLRDQMRGLQGVYVEHKGLTIAVHYRLAPHLRERVAEVTRSLLAELGNEFKLIDGNMVFEICPRAKDKGVAISEFMREAPFVGRLPVFVGDDTTDEDGFALINRLNGLSMKVGTGVSVARWRVADPSSVREWLAAYADYLARGRPSAEGAVVP